jgi:hypothetical protein
MREEGEREESFDVFLHTETNTQKIRAQKTRGQFQDIPEHSEPSARGASNIQFEKKVMRTNTNTKKHDDAGHLQEKNLFKKGRHANSQTRIGFKDGKN